MPGSYAERRERAREMYLQLADMDRIWHARAEQRFWRKRVPYPHCAAEVLDFPDGRWTLFDLVDHGLVELGDSGGDSKLANSPERPFVLVHPHTHAPRTCRLWCRDPGHLPAPWFDRAWPPDPDAS